MNQGEIVILLEDTYFGEVENCFERCWGRKGDFLLITKYYQKICESTQAGIVNVCLLNSNNQHVAVWLYDRYVSDIFLRIS